MEELKAHSATDPNGDTEFDEILRQMSESLDRGEENLLDAWCHRFPKYEKRLRRAFPGLLALTQLGQSDPQHDALSSKESSPLGDYRIIRELGRGGMGIVYEAEQMSLGRRVAIKVLRFAAMLDEKRLERFRTEARAAAMLDHPNIVSVHSVGCERGIHYFAMSLVEGQSLAEIVSMIKTDGKTSVGSTSSPLSADVADPEGDTNPIAQLSTQYSDDRRSYWNRIAKLFAQIGHALHYAHQQGVVHRDIKPSNLIIDHFGKPHITDFGLARIQNDPALTTSADMPGTLRYMSPEQISPGQIVDHRSDIFSLGLTLFELATGDPVRDADSHPKILHQIHAPDPVGIACAKHELPKDLETIIWKATENDAGYRYDTAADLAEDLERFAQRKAILAQRSTPWEQLCRRVATNPITACLVAAVFLLLVLLAAGSTLAVNRLSTRADALSAEVERREQVSYVKDMRFVQQLIQQGNFVAAEDKLLEHVVLDPQHDRRGFEWYHLWQASHDPALEQSISQALMVHSLDRLVDSELLAVGAWSHFIRIWDLAKEPGSPPKHEIPTDARMTRSIKHLPTRNSILTIDHRGVCREYSLETNECVWEYPLYDQQDSERIQYHAKILSERDRLVVFGGSPSHGHIAVFDLNSMELIVSKSNLPGHVSADVLQNGRLIVGYQNSANIEILNVDDLALVSEFELSGDGVECVCASPDKTKCVVSIVRRGDISDFCDLSLWNLRKQELQERVGIEGPPFRTIEFSPDGNLIATGQQSSGVVYLFDTDLQLLRKHPAHSMSVTDICFTADSKRMMTSGNDGAVHVWNLARFLATEQSITRLETQETFFKDAEFLDNDKACVTCSAGMITFDVRTGRELGRRALAEAEMESNAPALAISSDRKLIALAAESFPERQETYLEIFNRQTNETILTRRFNKGDSGSAKRAFSPDNRFYVHFIKKRVTVFDVVAGSEHFDFELPAESKSVAFAQDGKSCVFAAIDGMLYRYSFPELKFIASQRGDAELLIRASYASDGQRIAAVGFDRRVNLFDGETLKPIVPVSPFRRTAKYLVDVEFSPDGKRIVTASPDGTIRLWDSATGEELLMFRTTTAYYPHATFSPDGTKLLVACGDEVFVVHAPQQDKLKSLSVSQLEEIACQADVKPWARFEAKEE